MKAALLMLMLVAVTPVFGQDPVVTPEPGTFVLLSLGLAGAGLVAWKRKRKK